MTHLSGTVLDSLTRVGGTDFMYFGGAREEQSNDHQTPTFMHTDPETESLS